MWAQLSFTSRIAILQAAFIIMTIFVAAGALKMTGRGKHADPEIVASIETTMHPAKISKWLREYGWTLLCVPAATVIASTIRSRRDGGADSDNGWFAIGIGSVVALFLLLMTAAIQPFIIERSPIIRYRPATPPPEADGRPAQRN